MKDVTRAEVEAAFRGFVEVGDRCAESRDWSPWADIHSEDGLWVEHHLGTYRGREAIRAAIVDGKIRTSPICTR